MTLKERVEEYSKKINKEEIQMRYLLGAFGDTGNLTAIVEEDIFPEEGGAYCRFLGCSYLFKTCPIGMIPSELIELYGLAKKMVSKVISDIIHSKFLMFVVLCYWGLKKKRFYAIINEYTNIIYSKTIAVLPFNEKRYNVFAKELRRSLKKATENETHPIIEPLQRLGEIVIFLLQFDTAYNFPLQDIMSELDKTNDPIKEFNRLAELLEKRFQQESLKQKSRSLKKLNIFFRIPLFKRILTNFLKEIDVEKIQFDDADWYFCLRRRLYNFKDVPIEKRLKEADKIDKEKGHIKINVNFENV